MIFHYSLPPRRFRCWWARGLLVGVLFQQVLRNPLAEPTAKRRPRAQLGITVTTLWAIPARWPRSLPKFPDGSRIVGALVFGVAWGKRARRR